MKETVSDRLNLYITRNPNTNQRRLAQALKVHPTVINQWFIFKLSLNKYSIIVQKRLYNDKKKGFTIFAKPFKTTANMLYLRFTG